MFRKTEHGTDETTARDENAYEDNWYRSLKALAEHRALEHDDEPEQAVEDANPREEIDALAEQLSALSEGSDASQGEAALPDDEEAAVFLEEEYVPVTDGSSVIEPEVEAAPEPEVEPLPEHEFQALPDPAVQAAPEPEVQAAPEHEPRVVTEEPLSEPSGASLEVVPSAAASEQENVSSGTVRIDEVRELSVRAEHLIGRFRALRYPDGEDDATLEETTRARKGEPERMGAGSPEPEEMSTRAQQLLERLRTLRHLGDGTEEPRAGSSSA